MKVRKKVSSYLDPESVFVYQMGKVASTSLEGGLNKGIHVHNLYANDPCWVNMRLHFPGAKYYTYYLPGLFFLRCLFRSRSETKIVTMVRDPHERNISMFFQNLHAWLVHAYSGYPRGRSAVSIPLGREEGIGVLHKVYDEVFPKMYPLRWFDLEFKRLTGIDVYREKFSVTEGYGFAKNRNMSVLILRADRIASNVSRVEEFVGEKIEIDTSNVGSKKWYSGAYQEFLETYRMSELDRSMYADSAFVGHFFSEAEINERYS